MRKCLTCGETKEFSEFRKVKRYKYGVHSKCKKCESEYKRNYREVNKDKLVESNKVYKDNHKLEIKLYAMRVKYGLSKEEYFKLIENGCEICGSMSDPHVDHDHTTGKVRGCLCGKCNRALGLLNEDLHIMARMMEYTIRHGGHY